MNESLLSFIFRYLRNVFFASLTAFLGAAGWWWTNAEHTLLALGNAVMNIGFIIAVIGALSVMGGFMGTRTFQYVYTRSAGASNAATRTQQSIQDAMGTYRFQVVTIVVALFLFGVGALLRTW